MAGFRKRLVQSLPVLLLCLPAVAAIGSTTFLSGTGKNLQGSPALPLLFPAAGSDRLF
jgi:hypothetical protein